MTIGILELTPAFNSEVLEYAVTTTNATNKVTATTDDPSAIITIDLDGEEVENETSPTWASGENILTITVTDGASVTEYVVTVTKPLPVITTLSNIAVGSLDLTPAFDPATSSYTATTNVDEIITVTPTDERASIAITVNGDPLTNGTEATFIVGENAVAIHVGDPIYGSSSNSYYVTVTKE